MARNYIRLCIVVLVMLFAVMDATPPGIAKNPSQARCMDDRYKECKNLVHVCPKFCPESCSVNCVSCKPVCGNWTAPPPELSGSPPPVPQTQLPTSPELLPTPPSPSFVAIPPPVSPELPPSPPSTPTSDTVPPPSQSPPPSNPQVPPIVPSSPPPSQSPPPSTPQVPPTLPSSPPPSQSPTPSTPQVPPTVPSSPPPSQSPPPSTPQVPPTVPPSPPPSQSPPPSTPQVPPTVPPSLPPSQSTPPSTPQVPPTVPSSPPPSQSPPPSTPQVPPTVPPSPPPSQSPPPSTPQVPLTVPPSLPPSQSTPPSTPQVPPTVQSPPPSTPQVPPLVPSSDSSPPPPPSQSSPPTSTHPPPLIDAAGDQRVRCRNRNYPLCYGRLLQCPSACPQCFVDCNTCKAVCQCDYPGAVCQDPRFVGGDGITFYFHGKKDRDFCLVSDPDLHINAHFIGRRNKHMKRDFTWVQSIGILFGNHRLFLGALKTATWEDSIDHLLLSLDGEQILLPEVDGASWQSGTLPTLSITRVGGDANVVVVEVEGKLKITAKVVPITEHESRVHNYGITQDDCFAHLDLRFKFYSLSNEVDGILGQTYKPGYISPVKISSHMPVMGGDDKFSASGLFDSDCAVARFDGSSIKVESDGNSPVLELPSMGCSSPAYGKGLACKK